ncbi:methylenetetrahydrofolate reductase [NAD(P)H] [Blattabacterium sp. (Cryptocercus kyebangensis)]|uniref:methylenetetrahydrofolate reductase [NAD(P)H] n=1 Tax=Blattabacterium sp. (Cryptocercus kyebangensis) TaxID=298656 RepID=UPI000D7C8B10|nr:methylenetetrahydrofolate reductase [NAD(P)H] [Blattabacterium sp. (Cryptocercus kyebangensis)]AWU43835.1 methylenetetrahydrofolate reductase [NAD(P)H] [Blattabacterium sp. (Cryptocercus kyebangensis)]
MKVTDHINKAKKSLFSFEILPPLRGHDIKNIFSTLDPLMEFNPPFVDVTYHREEFFYVEKENGLLQRKKVSRRPGTVGICAAIMNKYGIDAVPHLICGGFNRQMTENALIDLNFLGIDNVLVLRGDPIKSENSFFAKKDGHKYAVELVEQVKNLNKGKYLNKTFEKKNYPLFDFCIGIAGYPEKHLEAPNMESDLFFLKKKVEAGANYIVTQMFFDNKKYFNFVKKCRSEGIIIPIIPGIKPISSKIQLNSLPSRFYLNIPNELVKEIEKAKDKKLIFNIGIEWAIQQSKELKNSGVKVIHYYTMDKPENIYKIVQAIY